MMEKHRSAVGLNLSVFVLMFGIGMIVPLLPQKIITLTGSLKTVGWLAASFALPFVLLQFPIGRLSGRWGFRWILITGYIFCSLSGLLYAFSKSGEAVFFGRMIQGIGEAPLWAFGPALLSMLYPASKGKAIGIYNAAIHLGLTLGSLFGIWVSGYGAQRLSFLGFAILGAMGALLILVTVKDPRMEPAPLNTPHDSGGIGHLLTQPETLAALLGIILYGAGYGISITVLPGFLVQAKGFTQAQAGWYFTLFYIGLSLSQVITGPISDRYGRRRSMIWGLLMAATGFWLFTGRAGWVVYPWLFLNSFGLGMFCVSALAWLNASVDDRAKGAISGAFYLFWGIGYFSGPLILGAAQGKAGNAAGFHGMAALYLLLALVQFFLKQHKGKILIKTSIRH